MAFKPPGTRKLIYDRLKSVTLGIAQVWIRAGELFQLNRLENAPAGRSNRDFLKKNCFS
jgi:hypothetical protein